MNTSQKILNSNFGINTIGCIKGEFGIGEGVRANIRAIEAAKIPFNLNNFHIDWHRNLDSTYQEEDFTTDNPYLVNLVNFNPDVLSMFIERFGHSFFDGHYNIGCWAWELLTFPPELQFGLELFDEIWTYSNYSVEAISAVSSVPVLKIMPSLALAQPSLDREALGLPKDKFIFLFMFDSLSTFERKNPVAVMEAFIQAFGKSHSEVLLVIKFSNSEHYPYQREQFKALAKNHEFIHLIEGHLMKNEVNALIYNCDCYVSLHRAEGFGLTMAEAMFYGKPVIATAYSSNIEFMNVGNSFLVKYDLVSIPEDIGPYKKGNIWAEPDIDHAAALMYYVFHNYQQASLVGSKAGREIQSLLSPDAIGSKIRKRLEQITTNVDKKPKRKASEEWSHYQAQAWKKTAMEAKKELDYWTHPSTKV